MKRVLQVVMVISVLLAGCGNSVHRSDHEVSKPSDASAAAAVAEAQRRVTGVCEAILSYGLPLDGETRAWLRDQLELLEPTDRRELAGDLERCAPDIAGELGAS